MTPVWPLSPRLFRASVLFSATLFFSSEMALAQFTQQGPKLVGTGAVGAAQQGFSVALSADGNTATVAGSTGGSGCIIAPQHGLPVRMDFGILVHLLCDARTLPWISR
jgi:hypothetical protein